MFDARKLQYLDLAQNHFEIPRRPSPADSALSTMHRRCIGGEATCFGVLPDSCSAFGPGARESLHSTGSCFECTNGTLGPLAAIILAVLIAMGFFISYVKVVKRFPHFRRWIATSSILLSHVQTLGIVGELLAVYDTGVAGALRNALSAITDLSWAAPQCLLPQTAKAFLVSGAIAIFTSISSLLLLVCMKKCSKWHVPAPVTDDSWLERAEPLRCSGSVFSPHGYGGSARNHRVADAIWERWQRLGGATAGAALEEQADFWEACVVIVYSLSLPTICRYAILGLQLGPEAAGGLVQPIALAVVAFELIVTLRFLRQVLILRGKVVRYCIDSRTLTHERLVARLRYLVGKYDDHAPYWQFVLWLRQIALVVLSVLVKDAVLQAVLSVLIILLGLLVHTIVRPYKYPYQNRLEVWLSSSGVVFIALASWWTDYHSHRHGRRSLLPELVYCGVLLSPSILYADAVAKGWQRPAPEGPSERCTDAIGDRDGFMRDADGPVPVGRI